MGGVRTEPAQEVHQHGGARNPIDVVVTQDGDALTLVDGTDDAFGGFAEPADGERIGDICQLRTQVTLRLRLVGEGGMGTVYEAEQQNPQRTGGLKVIRSKDGDRPERAAL